MKTKLSITFGLMFALLSSSLQAAEGVVQVQTQIGDETHLCVKGAVDITVLHPSGNPYSLAEHNILYSDGKIFGLAAKDGPISLYNSEDRVSANHTEFFIIRTLPLVDIKDIDGDQAPYIQYIPAGSSITPCQSETAFAEGYLFDSPSLIVSVTEITAPAAVVLEPIPEAQDPIVLPDDNADADEVPVAPAGSSGGCSLGVGSSNPAINFTVGLFFALILGTHALFRFRKE